MKRDLLLGLILAAGPAAWAASSPYAGATAAEGTYYLYQVETGTWLSTNRTDINDWTTKASLNDTGFDVKLIKAEGFNEGFQIFCNLTNNGSLNGTNNDRFYLDTGHALTEWIFEPATVDGVSNAYHIKAKATGDGVAEGDAISADYYIGSADGAFTDNPTERTWQLVTREERLKKMQADAANGPVDASWLIPWNDHGRNDIRDRGWVRTVTDNFGGGQGFGGSNGYPVQEYWHQITMHHQTTLTDLPTGTYGFSVQAYYRDTEIESAELAKRRIDGAENLRVSYFAGAATGTVMSIFQDAKAVQTDGYTYNVVYTSEEGEAVDLGWVPNSTDNASLAMFNGAYVNEYIKAPVSDGTLTIGIDKPAAEYRDWLIYKRFYLTYYGSELIAEDLSGLQAQLDALIAEGEGLPQTPYMVAAIAAAKEARTTAKSSTALLAAITDIENAVKVIKDSRSAIEAFAQVKAITDKLGIDPTAAQAQYDAATSKGGYEDAVRTLRYARRLLAADKQADVFAGNPVATGKFYIYNVGMRMFLTGGSDWGAHAALGLPGTEVELVEQGASDKTGLMKYALETGLYNGDNNHYLSTRGYMDAPIDLSNFSFMPVEGKDNVYYIIQGDWPDVYMAWDPYGSTDGGNNDELNVCTESRDLDAANLNAQWKLVKRADRDALIAKAALDNPVDVSHFIQNPGFNQRAPIDSWMGIGTSFAVARRGDNRPDFVCESYSGDGGVTDPSLSINVEGLPAGIYRAYVQGYFRAGELADQVNAEPAQIAYFYADNGTGAVVTDVALPNILAETGMAPGEGDNLANADASATYQVPNSPEQASAYFKAGLYKVNTVVEYPDASSPLPLGIYKDTKIANGDWIVVDNFRLYYYGNQTTRDEVINAGTGTEPSGIDEVAAERPADGRIYNLQGIQVANPTHPGVYIQDGRKFIVR